MAKFNFRQSLSFFALFQVFFSKNESIICKNFWYKENQNSLNLIVIIQCYKFTIYINIYVYIHTYLYVLEFVAHSVDLLDVGEYQLGVNPTV